MNNHKTVALDNMQIPQYDLINIVEQANTIAERLEDVFILNQTPGNDNIANSRIANWYQLLAEGNQEKFEKRLAWDGLNLSTIRRVLGSVRLVDDKNLPAWVETFKAALEATDLGTLEGKKSYCLNHEKPLPFEEIFLPFIYVARQKLKLKLVLAIRCWHLSPTGTWSVTC